jgi:hypothetical protein
VLLERHVYLERHLYEVCSEAPGADTEAIMTLHRDIYWLGRQWAVTGHGIQAVNKKLHMRFDVAASRIWEEGLDQPMRELDWFDAEDFAEALRVARRLSQETPAKFQPLAGGEK